MTRYQKFLVGCSLITIQYGVLAAGIKQPMWAFVAVGCMVGALWTSISRGEK